MASGAVTGVKKFGKNKKNQKRRNKIALVFDEDKRRDFLTGFHKRKVQRKKDAQDKLKKDLKDERRRLKSEAKESYKKMVVSHRTIPELENLLQEEYYEDDDVTVKVVELSTNDIARQNNWIGANQPIYQQDEQSDDEDSEEVLDDDKDVVPGMDLKKKNDSTKTRVVKEVQKQFDTERDVKRALKKEATKKVQKSKVFQLKNKLERQKQRKKSMHLKKERTRQYHEKKSKNKKKH